MKQILRLHEQLQAGMDHIHLATCWYRLGTLAAMHKGDWLQRNADRLEPLRDHTMAMIPLLEAQGVSNTAYGLAKASLGNVPPWTSLLEELAAAAVRMRRTFNPQSIANMV